MGFGTKGINLRDFSRKMWRYPLRVVTKDHLGFLGAIRGRRAVVYPALVPTTLSLGVFRRVARMAQGSLIGIVLTGSWVRLTGSGLGCSDWPECNSRRFVDVSSWHAAIEQVNRLLTGVVSAAVVGAVLASFLVRPLPRHARWLAASLVGGVVIQVIIGAYVVWTGLNPWSNMAHFLVSASLIVLSTLLVHVGRPEAVVQLPNPHFRTLGAVLGVVMGVAIVTGTVVTGSGPHAGDENAIRLGFAIHEVVRIHSASVWLAVLVLCGIAVKASRSNERALFSPLSVVIGCTLAQGFLGYVQYFANIPAALVALHIAGAVLVTVATTRLVVVMWGSSPRLRA